VYFRALKTLKVETSAWADVSNEKQRGADWQFTIENAHKTEILNPKISFGKSLVHLTQTFIFTSKGGE
jgi:hypothetical protein